MINSNIRIYTAGAMEQVNDGGIEWRLNLESRFRDKYKDIESVVEFLHPEIPTEAEEVEEYLEQVSLMKALRNKFFEDFEPKYMNVFNDIVPLDIEIIGRSDLLAVFLDQAAVASHGTISEMSIAAATGKPYYVLLDEDLKGTRPSLWCSSAVANATLISTGISREDFINIVVSHYMQEENV